MCSRVFIAACMLTCSLALADGPADNIPTNVRRIPKLGIEVPADRQARLEAGLKELGAKITALKSKKIDPPAAASGADDQSFGFPFDLKSQQEREEARRKLHNALIDASLADVEIYFKAVHDALVYQEFFDARELNYADRALQIGLTRADQLAKGETPWTTATGLVVRGYVSKIDGSVQPYGLVVPESYTSQGPGRFRCDLWFHGRGETLSELNFIRDRSTNVGQYAPEDTIVLHPYGRYCNANKFAGEIDALEALDSVQQRYRLEKDQIGVRGFSMGGASTWQFAVHYADRWFAANPGAGFSETPDFLKVFQQETLKPTWWEQRLWHWYDCTDWAINLRHCPTVAYSGENDRQKQAADMMTQALAKEGIELTHIIGPKTAHSIHAQSKIEIEQRMNSLARSGRDWLPPDLEFVTYTLRYNKLHWLSVDGLAEHWSEGRVSASLLSSEIKIEPDGVTDLTLSFPAGASPFDVQSRVILTLGEQELAGPAPQSDKSWTASLHKVRGQWRLGKRPDGGLRKTHGLTGPIDDAFLDRFLFVRPTGKAWHELAGKWSAAELDRAIEHWRRHFRGQAQVKDDNSVTPEDIASSNLVLWGDPNSNSLLQQIADKLPIRWTDKEIAVGNKQFPSGKHALIAIYPNPLNPSRYVVLNSSFTFRDYAYLNNARQVPMLPDWAVVDLTTPPNSIWPGKIADADFFGERWELKVSEERRGGGTAPR